MLPCASVSKSKCKTILVKITFICMKIKLHAELIFIWKVLHLDSIETEATSIKAVVQTWLYEKSRFFQLVTYGTCAFLEHSPVTLTRDHVDGESSTWQKETSFWRDIICIINYKPYNYFLCNYIDFKIDISDCRTIKEHLLLCCFLCKPGLSREGYWHGWQLDG